MSAPWDFILIENKKAAIMVSGSKKKRSGNGRKTGMCGGEGGKARPGSALNKREAEPWYTKVKKELEMRDRLCKQRAPNDVYKRPATNPYSYKSVEEFRKRHPFNKNKDCKFVAPGSVDIEMDPYKRYYKHIGSKKECDSIWGKWVENSVNRKYRYEDGVCWRNDKTAYCSKYEPKLLLRHGHEKDAQINKDALMAQGSKRCNEDEKCNWVKMKTGADCFDVDTANKLKRRVSTPPPEMPVDITGSKPGIEQFLYDFYARGEVLNPESGRVKIYRPVIAPAFTPLEGTGNRCAPQKGGRDKPANVDVESRMKTDEDELYEEIDAFGRPRKKAVEDAKMKIPGADEKIDEDGDVPRMLPSLSQSVINMIVKNWMIKEDKGESVTNRGMLAWHSTGSGKTCTAAGVMDGAWKSKRDIIFASSLDALASNPPSNFHECLYNLYPDWQDGKVPSRHGSTGAEQTGEYENLSKEAALAKIASEFEKRGVRFLSFAKLSNRVKKTVESGVLKHRQGGGARRKQVEEDEEEYEAPKRRNNQKNKKSTSSSAKGKTTKKTTTGSKKSTGATKGKKPPSKQTTRGKKKVAEEDEEGGFFESVKRALGVKKTVKTKKASSETSRPRKARGVGNAGPHIAKEDIIDLNNTVLIVDEVHNLFRPLPTQRLQHEYLKKELIDPTRWPGLKIVILSATPGDSIEDVLMLLNMIRDPTHPAIKAPRLEDPASIERFKDDVRGLISYFDMSSDRTRFPVVRDTGEAEMMPMDPVQFEKYMEAYLKTVKEKKATNYEKLAKDNMLNKYWAPARKYSNMLYTFEKGMKVSEFSSKLPALLEKIRGYEHEKHYVYSAFYDNRNKGWSSQGILAIANVMEKELGYTKFTLDMARFDKAGNVVSMPAKGKKYLLVTLKELGGDSNEPGKLSSSAGDKLKRMLKVYNHPDNRYGEYIHVMLASNAFNEGIDLKSVRHIHFFEPLVTMASDKQTIGRAARFCSHADLDKDKGEWTVDIHRYMSYYPVNIQLRGSKSGANAAKVVEQTVGPTAEEREKMDRYEGRIAEARAKLTEVERELEGLKGVTARSKDEAAKARKEGLKERQKALKDEVKEGEAAVKLIKKSVDERDKASAKLAEGKVPRRKKGTALTSVDTDSVKMIDEFIFKESRERVKELMVVYQCMKEAAVDCRLLQKFHAVGNNKYGCEAWEKRAPKEAPKPVEKLALPPPPPPVDLNKFPAPVRAKTPPLPGLGARPPSPPAARPVTAPAPRRDVGKLPALGADRFNRMAKK